MFLELHLTICTRFDTVPECDGQTDGRIDRTRTMDSVLRALIIYYYYLRNDQTQDVLY